MQTTSATWQTLLAAGARLETKVVIGGNEYTLMTNPVITRALMQDGLSIGNAVCASCRFSLLTPDTIPRAAEVQVSMRLTDGTTDSEWLPAGTFYIAKRARDPVTGILTLECYDAMLKANALLKQVPWTTDGGDVVTTNNGEWLYFSARSIYPCDAEALAEDIARVMSLEIDSRTSLQGGSAYKVTSDTGEETIHDLLCRIAAMNAGNWIITPEGKLRLVPLVSAADAAGATEDAVDVIAVTTEISAGAAGTVTGIRYHVDDTEVILGSESGLVIDANVNAAVASDLYDRLVGLTYQPYSLDGAIYDPAAELGDYLRAGANGEVASVLCVETAVLAGMFHGSVAAPQAAETADEYPYIGSASGKALVAAKAYVNQSVGALNSALDQEGIFNRLTGNGTAQGLYMVDGQLYVNMSYARAGTLILGGLNNQNGLLEVQDASGNVIGQWRSDGIHLDRGAILFPLTGSSGDGNYVALNKDGIPFESVITTQNGACRIRLNNFAFTLRDENTGNLAALSSNTLVLSDYEHNNSFFPSIELMNDKTELDVLLSPKGLLIKRKDGTQIAYLYSDGALVTGPMSVTGNLTVGGTVSAGNGASGTFTVNGGRVVTVSNGIIIGIA